MKATELVVRCLEREGVEYIFGVPGEEIMDLLNALCDSTITFVSTRHEQGAAFMADVYGRLSGRAGVCLATLGPGATNLMTGVADATTSTVSFTSPAASSKSIENSSATRSRTFVRDAFLKLGSSASTR